MFSEIKFQFEMLIVNFMGISNFRHCLYVYANVYFLIIFSKTSRYPKESFYKMGQLKDSNGMCFTFCVMFFFKLLDICQTQVLAQHSLLHPFHYYGYQLLPDSQNPVYHSANLILHKAMFTPLRFRFYPFLLMKTLPVHIAPFSDKYAMKTIGVHIAPAKWCC